MEVVKKQGNLTIVKKRSGRFAVKDSNGKFIGNGEKINALVEAGLITVAVKKVEEAPAEETPAE